MPITSVNAYFFIGVFYEKQKDYKKSIQMFKHCLSLDSSHFSATLHLATLLANCGESEKAIKYFNHALQLDKNNINAHFGLGKLQHSTNGDLESAERHFRIVLK